MAAPKKPREYWQALRGCSLKNNYEPNTRIEPNGNHIVVVQENDRSVDMDKKVATPNQEEKDKDPYGIPITAQLGIGLIADLQRRLDKATKTIDNFAEKNNFLEMAEWEWLKDLVKSSSAITIDKSVILKTLSQPGCEGMRFYLCRKVIQHGKNDTKETPYLSLVTVGVNSLGQDLHYDYKPGKMQGGLLKANLEDKSLVTEYGSPPPPETKDFNPDNFEDFDERYALLKYAQEESLLVANNKKQPPQKG